MREEFLTLGLLVFRELITSLSEDERAVLGAPGAGVAQNLLETVLPKRLCRTAWQALEASSVPDTDTDRARHFESLLQATRLCVNALILRKLDVQRDWVELADRIGVDEAGELVTTVLSSTDLIPVADLPAVTRLMAEGAARAKRVPSSWKAKNEVRPPRPRRSRGRRRR